jgi:SAM-dependent methyltransferase
MESSGWSHSSARGAARPPLPSSDSAGVAANELAAPSVEVDEASDGEVVGAESALVNDAYEHRIVVDPTWGYRRLDPVPSRPELDDFYESRYSDLLRGGGRAPDLARLVAGGPDAAIERQWQAATLHADVLTALDGAVEEGAPWRVLDVGCGTGELMRSLVAAGWDAVGTEPAAGIAEVGRAAGLRIEAATAAEFIADWREHDGEPFGGIVLMNVLEHVPDPASLLETLLAALAPAGRLLIRVPNDFSPLQEAAHRALGGRRWWIAIPDHVNYFDHASIGGLVEAMGLTVVERSADYPVELFLLGGEDYRNDPAVGHAIHNRRRRIELSLDPATRRALGHAWAAAGIGRNAFVVGRNPA